MKELLKTDISRKRKLLLQFFHVIQRDESVKERLESRHQVHGNRAVRAVTKTGL